MKMFEYTYPCQSHQRVILDAVPDPYSGLISSALNNHIAHTRVARITSAFFARTLPFVGADSELVYDGLNVNEQRLQRKQFFSYASSEPRLLSDLITRKQVNCQGRALAIHTVAPDWIPYFELERSADGQGKVCSPHIVVARKVEDHYFLLETADVYIDKDVAARSEDEGLISLGRFRWSETDFHSRFRAVKFN